MKAATARSKKVGEVLLEHEIRQWREIEQTSKPLGKLIAARRRQDAEEKLARLRGEGKAG